MSAVALTAAGAGIDTWLSLAKDVPEAYTNITNVFGGIKAGAPSPPGSQVFGWGPERATFTVKSPAPYIALNSITDNPAYGDERNFVRVKLADQPNNTFTDDLTVNPGDTVEVGAIVDNDVADNLPNNAVVGLTAQKAFKYSDDGRAGLFVTFEGQNVKSVWDSATLKSKAPIKVQYIKNSLRFISVQGPKDGFQIPDDGFADGQTVTLGDRTLDGNFPAHMVNGLEAGAGYLTFRVMVYPAT
ncbi:hypothetical protein [Sinomonas soli]